MSLIRYPLRALLLLFLLTWSAASRGRQPPDSLPVQNPGADAPGSPRLDAIGDPLPPHALARIGTTRWRHDATIVGLAYSADGKRLVSASSQTGLAILDAVTGRRIRSLESGPVRTGPVAISADGKRVAALQGDVGIWDVESGEEVGRFGTRIFGFALAPDGKQMVTLSWSQGPLLWKSEDEIVLADLPKSSSAVVLPGKLLLLDADRRLRVWDLATRKEQGPLEQDTLLREGGSQGQLAASADGRTIAARDKGAIRLWDGRTGKAKRSIPIADDQIPVQATDFLALSADGRTVALAGNDRLLAFDCQSGKERFRRLEPNLCAALALSPDGRTIAWSVRRVPTIYRWDLDAGRELPLGVGRQTAFHSLDFALDGSRLATSGDGAAVRVWKLDLTRPSKDQLKPLLLPTGENPSRRPGGKCAWSPDGKRLALARSPEGIALRDPATGELVRTLAGPKECRATAFSADGRLLAVGDNHLGKADSPEGQVWVWEVDTGRLVRTLKGHGGPVRSLAFSGDGKQLASGSDGVRLWDLKGNLVQHFKSPNGLIDTLTFTRDGQALIAGGEAAQVWDLATGEELHRLSADARQLEVALSPDGRVLATGGADAVVRLWDLATGLELLQLTGHSGPIQALAYRFDGKVLASGSQDTTILLWEVHQAIRAGIPKRQRPLTEADRKRLWDDLGKADSLAGHRAVWTLADDPAAVAFLKGQLLQGKQLTEAERIAQLIKQLDDDSFPKREEASQQLTGLKKASLIELRKTLDQNPSAEVRKRILHLLADLGPPRFHWSPGDMIRTARVIQVLELIGTAEARQVLESVQKGAAVHNREDASAALRRLDRLRRGK